VDLVDDDERAVGRCAISYFVSTRIRPAARRPALTLGEQRVAQRSAAS
jgi:hypothetical protein